MLPVNLQGAATASQADSEDLYVDKVTECISATRKMEIWGVGRKANFTEISATVLSSEKGINYKAHQKRVWFKFFRANFLVYYLHVASTIYSSQLCLAVCSCE